MKLLLNRIKTPDGTILTSYYTHDFVMHTDKNGQQYGVDGGTAYAKRIGNTNECEDLSVWIDENKLEESFDVIRDTVHWGTRGKEGDEPLRWVKLKEMTDEHLDNLINVYKGPIDAFIKKCFNYEIEYRKKGLITLLTEKVKIILETTISSYLFDYNTKEIRSKMIESCKKSLAEILDLEITDETTDDLVDKGYAVFFCFDKTNKKMFHITVGPNNAYKIEDKDEN